MARMSGFNNRFNAGELSQEAWSDTDLQQHSQGCALALNGIGLVAGPMEKRPGLLFAGLTKVQAEVSRLIPFARTPEDALMIEMGAGYGRLWQTDLTPLLSAGTPVEFTHAYTQAQLAGIRFQQNGDLIVLCHADSTVRTRRLKRISNTSWDLDDFVFEDGPWRPENLDQALTLTVTVGTATSETDTDDAANGSILASGTVALVASAALFDAAHVGALFRLRQSDGNPGTDTWLPGGANGGTGAYRLSNGRVYKRTAGANPTGLTPPVHESGTVSDGKVSWLARHDGAGVVQITVVTDSTHATAEVVRTLPFKTGGVTSYWAEGAYSDYRGWPTAKPAIREERLVFGAPEAAPDKFEATTTAGFTPDKGVFTPGLGTGRVVDTDAVGRFAGDDPGRIVWLLSASHLLAGTTAGEVVISGATLDDPLSPSGCVARGLTDYGSADVMPIKAHDAVLYVMGGRRTLRELRVAPDQSFSSRDLSVLASHVTAAGIAELAWQKSENRAWLRLADGGLAAFTYHVEQGVYGFTRQRIGDGTWTVESIAGLPGADGANVLWAIISRIKAAATQRAIVALAARDGGVYYDAAEVYEGAAATGVSGLTHLAGETISLLADDAEYTGIVVSGGGAANLPTGAPAATRIVAGQPYSFRFESLPLDLQGAGSMQGAKIRTLQALVVLSGVRARVGGDTGRLDPVTLRRPSETLSLVPKRHVAKITFAGDAGVDPRVVVEDDSGWKLTLHMIRAGAEANA